MPDDIDRRIVAATQNGLPLVAEPYRVIAGAIGIAESDLLERFARLLSEGAIRRIGAIPNHYALGYTANAMTVWDVDDQAVAELGQRVGALDFVTHCYERPRHLPLWPYNLFAMIHGRSREEVMNKLEQIALLIGPAARAHDILFSTRILKKTGLQLAA